MKNDEMSMRTKQALAEALKKRMEVMSFQKIKISDLIKDCNITRSTFYYYFDDIYDLLEWLLDKEAVELVESYSENNEWEQGILMLLQYITDNADMCHCIYNSVGNIYLQKMMFHQAKTLIGEYIDKNFPDLEIDPTRRDFVEGFYSRAYLAQLAAWVDEDMAIPPKEMVKLVRDTVSAGIAASINNSAEPHTG